jgi:hypothetical protein
VRFNPRAEWYTFTCCEAQKSRTVTFETPKNTFDNWQNIIGLMSKVYLDAMDFNAIGAFDFQFHDEGRYTPNNPYGLKMLNSMEMNIKAKAVCGWFCLLLFNN